MKRNIALVVCLAAAAMAQTAPEATNAAEGFGQKMKQNTEALKQYSFKRRTEAAVNGRSRSRVELVRYVNGQMEAVPLESPAPAEAPHARGLRGRMMQKKVEEKKEEMQEAKARLTGLMQQYTESDALRNALSKAAISREGSGPDASVKVEAKGIVNPGDSFTLVWSVANRRPASIEIHASLEGKPVEISRQYASLPDGTFYAARTVLSAPKKDVKVTIDTYDYTLAGR